MAFIIETCKIADRYSTGSGGVDDGHAMEDLSSSVQ